MDRRKAIVAAGYDDLVDHFAEWAARVADAPRARFLAEFTRHLPAESQVLDLGCGNGLPTTRELSNKFKVVGVDISGAQISAARRNVPNGTFVQSDFAELRFDAGSFEGVVALYAISHLPRDEHAELFRRIADWLAPGGLFLATLGASDSPDWIGPWLGVPMFFSSYDAATNRRLLLEAGFDVLIDEVLEVAEPEGTVAFEWVLARKPSRGPYDRDAMATDSRVDAYLATLPADQRELLQHLRARIARLVPDAGETISYGMPAFKLHGRFLMSFAGWKAHCSIYPVSDSVLGRHADALKGYGRTKGSLHFTSEKPLPDEVLEDLVRARVADIERGDKCT
jgi:uncharacterized protein YdhG (YjbR/CyaY superfamily)/2-polyprenyl-3-methyl-5-hydroxy-6-metoxy-1,4-benzoquinol methylase